eukprot:3936028-Karenia_brevis.AAC.1
MAQHADRNSPACGAASANYMWKQHIIHNDTYQLHAIGFGYHSEEAKIICEAVTVMGLVAG